MLILTRRPGESIKIGSNIEVCLMGVQGSQVRLGIAAPKAISVDRAEVRERKDAGLPPKGKPQEKDP